jgi:hypothetical protein
MHGDEKGGHNSFIICAETTWRKYDGVTSSEVATSRQLDCFLPFPLTNQVEEAAHYHWARAQMSREQLVSVNLQHVWIEQGTK